MKTNASKAVFLGKVREIYRFMNAQDTSDKARWTARAMVGAAGCVHIDRMIEAMVAHCMLTEQERQDFINSI